MHLVAWQSGERSLPKAAFTRRAKKLCMRIPSPFGGNASYTLTTKERGIKQTHCLSEKHVTTVGLGPFLHILGLNLMLESGCFCLYPVGA
jgi:hypothetical protein